MNQNIGEKYTRGGRFNNKINQTGLKSRTPSVQPYIIDPQEQLAPDFYLQYHC